VKLFLKETKSAPSAACATELLDVIPAIMQAIRVHMRRASVSELSVPQFRTLGFISRQRERSISDLAEHIGLSLPSASKLVQSLLTRGYLHREVDQLDRRRMVLAPTAKGQRVLRVARAAARDFLAGLISELQGEQRHVVIEAMHTLREIFAPTFAQPQDAGASMKNGSARRVAKERAT
jgi:DNA-binding MarR family transcriptional regulator